MNRNFRPPHILVIDDDARLRDLLARYFAKQDWYVTCAKDATDAREKLRYFLYDLLVLDVMMPHETGIEFAQKFRQTHDTPILMLTAMGEAYARITGLEAGADDYLPKPFEPRELLLRARAILSRTMQPDAPVSVIFGDFTFDMQQKRLMQGNETIYLTESEAALLALLAEHINETVSRETIVASLSMSEEETQSRAIDVLVTRLRKKLESVPSRPNYLHTVRGVGYSLRQ